MKEFIINTDEIANLISSLPADKWDILAPAKDGKSFDYVLSSDKPIINSEAPPSKISFKEYFFPKSETLFYYKREANEISLTEPKFAEKKLLVLAAKPCDAASLPILSKVFNWDYKDEFFNKRVNNSVIIGLSCAYSDESCFCTSVGLDRNNTKGSDIFLTPFNDKQYVLSVVSDKGDSFVKEFLPNLTEFTGTKETKEFIDNKPFDYKKTKDWIAANFENKIWAETGEVCIGCAQCAFVCPTCHCFDIVDENCDLNCGRRIKNWDACQFGVFTKHASGHNPRNSQEKRYRQRVSHKFDYYYEKFGEVLCTGCGRCTRGCPAGIDIGEIVFSISNQ
ncbi:MAG: 4Fe-4S dicluster domain-containing protein [Bacteroidota bacterium]|nr:4Fe-4S dicluster domain-containing protein [Bacteroidota bacterium]